MLFEYYNYTVFSCKAIYVLKTSWCLWLTCWIRVPCGVNVDQNPHIRLPWFSRCVGIYVWPVWTLMCGIKTPLLPFLCIQIFAILSYFEVYVCYLLCCFLQHTTLLVTVGRNSSMYMDTALPGDGPLMAGKLQLCEGACDITITWCSAAISHDKMFTLPTPWPNIFLVRMSMSPGSSELG